MRVFLSDRAPALLLMVASLILAVGFCLPVGGERQSRTQYRRLAGFVGTFETSPTADSAGKGIASPRGETWGLVAQAVRQRYTPVQADALLSRVESFSKGTPKPVSRGHGKARKTATSAPPVSVEASSATTTPAMTAALPVPARAVETAYSVSDRFENDLSKYSLDRSAAQGPITFRLLGLSRNSGRYVLKVAVTNRSDDDFFVRDFVLRDGRDILAAKSYFRLFVEPGRTREGFVVFDRPRNGADVHIALKEDREKGRVVEMPVPYPF